MDNEEEATLIPCVDGEERACVVGGGETARAGRWREGVAWHIGRVACRGVGCAVGEGEGGEVGADGGAEEVFQ